MELIFFIFIIIAIINKASKETPNQTSNQTSNQQKTSQSNANAYSRPRNNQTFGAEKNWEKAARENIERAARRAGQIANKALNDLFEDEVSSPETEEMTAAERIRVRRMEENRTTILQRAKGNAAENKQDVTLDTMEAEHNHSERVSAAVHHHPEDIIPENMLGSVEDLIIKGYDGNLCFERDFVGEGLDMISRFTVPSDIPDYSKANEES